MREFRPTIAAVLRNIRSRWKQLVATEIVYKLIAFVVLTPLMGVMFRALLSTSGEAVLADQDILLFLTVPTGWLCLIIVGALWLAIAALKQSALVAILADSSGRVSVLAALRFALLHAWPVLQVMARLVTLTLVVVAPFAVAAGMTYRGLLSEYDINFYLKEQPPEFVFAVGMGIVLIISLVAILLRLYTGWFYALPLVLFEQITPAATLSQSTERADGHRGSLLLWIIVWALSGVIFSTLTTAPVIAFGHWLVPHSTSSLSLLSASVGLTLTLSFIAGLLANLMTTISFAALLLHLYEARGRRAEVKLKELELWDAAPPLKWQLTGARLLAGTLIAALIALFVGVSLIDSVQLKDQVEITAHRGASADAPENTLAAVQQAIQADADWIEIDVQESADGEVVVFHDSDFKKIANLDLKIWNAKTSDLQHIDIGSWFDPKYSDQRVPFLRDVLAACQGKVKVNIELKSYGHGQRLEERVAEIVETENMVSDVVIMSLKAQAVRRMKMIRPTWRVGQLMSVMVGRFQDIEADFLAVNASFASRNFVRQAHAHGKEVQVWTVNDPASMSNAIGRGVDNLITDKPAMARTVLAERAEMNPLERLLLELAEILGVEPEIGKQ